MSLALSETPKKVLSRRGPYINPPHTIGAATNNKSTATLIQPWNRHLGLNMFSWSNICLDYVVIKTQNKAPT